MRTALLRCALLITACMLLSVKCASGVTVSVNDITDFHSQDQAESKVNAWLDGEIVVEQKSFDSESMGWLSTDHEFSTGSFPEEDFGVFPIPEPATMMLFGTGLACIAGLLRRSRRAVSSPAN